MPLVKCRFCGKERRISLGSNLLPSEVNDLHMLCQPSCFKMLHSRGTFADLNQKEVLVPIIDIFHDMDLQQKAMANIDVAMTHRAENSTMRQQDIAAPPPSGRPADRHSNTNCGNNGIDNGPPLTTPSLVDSSAVSQPHSLHSSADHESTPLHRRSPSSDISSSANCSFPSAQPPPRSITTPPPTSDMRSLYIPPVHYTSSLRATSAEQPPTGPSDLPPAFEPSPPSQPAASSDYLRIIERFRSRRLEDLDDRNNVLRLDLTPAIDLRTPLAAAETAAVIGCLENVEFVVVVQGLAARLNASYWTVSFLLTSLPPLLPVQCDHYRADRHGVMTFVGSVLVPLRAVHAHFLHGSPVQLPYPDGPVVVGGGPDDGLALHDMELAFHSTLVHANLKTHFGWDVFAGGAHCWMQYMPSQYQDMHRFEPKLHMCRPSGQRSELIYSGNGSTDTAYQVVLGEMELVVFDPLTAKQRSRVLDFLRRMGYLPGTRADLVDKYLHNLNKFGYKSSVVQVRAGEYAHVHKGRLHLWRSVGGAYPMLVYITWEWTFQGVTPQGIHDSAKFLLDTAVAHQPSSVAPSPLQYIFNPRNCFLEAIRQWLALTTLDTGACVPHLRAVLPVLERLVDEDQAVHDDGDDGWFLGAQHPLPARHHAGPNRTLPPHLSRCRLCSNELSNTFKQCLGCTVYDVAPPFVVCVDCSRAPSRFDPRAGIRSSAGHTGSLPRSQAYKERSDVVAVCECPGRTPCSVCEGCDQCSCLCHTMFLTRYRLLRLVDMHHLVVARTAKDTRRL